MAKRLIAKIYHKRLTGQFTRYWIQLVFLEKYAHCKFTICSLYIVFTIYSLYVNYMWPYIFINMFTIYSLYVHNMFTICSLYVHYMFTVCLLMTKKLVAKIYHERLTCQFKRYQIQLVFPKEYVHYMFTIYSSYVYYIFTICSPYVHNMFTVCSLDG